MTLFRLLAPGSLAPLLPLLLLLFSPVARVQAQTLYAVVLGNQKYVVGSSTLHSGLFRSRDGGERWEHLGPENLKAFSMDAVESSGGRLLYIAAGNGVHRSNDSGATWRIVTGWEITEVLDVKVAQSNPRWVFAATAWGLWASGDGGDSWQRIVDSSRGDGRSQPRYCYRLLSTRDGTVLLTDSAIYSIVIPPEGNAVLQRRAMIDAPRALVEDVPFAGTVVGTTHLRGYEPGSFKPHPGANPILDAIEQTPEGAIYDLLEWRSPEELHDGIHPIVMASDRGIGVIHPGKGSVWQEYNAGLPPSPVHTLAWLPGYNRLVAGTFGEGVFRFEHDRWIPSGLEGSQIWRLVVKP